MYKTFRKNSVIVAMLLVLVLIFTAGCGKKEEVAQVSSSSLREVHQDIENVKIDSDGEKALLESLMPPSYPTLALPRLQEEDKPRLAIVIDDLGGGLATTKELFKLEGYPLTVAVMPGAKQAAKEAQEAAERGFCVIMHQPMEPLVSNSGLGDGAILADMTDEEILEVMRKNFDILPNVVGVNNHMGSKATSDARVMKIVLEEVKRRGLFFFDSITTNKSVVTQVADTLGMKTLINVKFLDNEDTEEYVTAALMDAINIAKQRGYAAVIGHTRKATVSVLAKILPELEEMGIELVTLEDLMKDDTLDTRLQFVPVKRETKKEVQPVTTQPKTSAGSVKSESTKKEEVKKVDTPEPEKFVEEKKTITEETPRAELEKPQGNSKPPETSVIPEEIPQTLEVIESSTSEREPSDKVEETQAPEEKEEEKPEVVPGDVVIPEKEELPDPEEVQEENPILEIED